MSWKLAPCLDAARSEANRLAPNRKRTADGTIGDAAHAASVSDHNPTPAGWVNALDLTHDPAGGFDAHAWADAISRRNDPRVKYLISRGRIWNPTIGDKPGAWRRYTGSNPHNSHLHISVRDTSAARNDRSPWFGSAAPQPPVVAPQPPTPVGKESDSMFLHVEGLGLFIVVGDKVAGFSSPASWEDARRKSPGVPTAYVPKSVGEQIVY